MRVTCIGGRIGLVWVQMGRAHGGLPVAFRFEVGQLNDPNPKLCRLSGSSPNSKTKGQTPHDRFASSSVAFPLEDLTWTTRPLMADNGTKLRADPLPKFRWIRSGTGVPPKPCWGKGETIGNQQPNHYSSRPPGHQSPNPRLVPLVVAQWDIRMFCCVCTRGRDASEHRTTAGRKPGTLR